MQNSLEAQLIDNDDDSLVTIIYNGIVLDITEDRIYKFDQGVATNLNVVPILHSDEIFLSARTLLEALGYRVDWDKDTKTIYAVNNAALQDNDNYEYGEFNQLDYSYKGILYDNIPNVRGQMVFSNGNIYKGEIFQAIVSGSGIVEYPDGDVFKGNFNNGQRNGIAEYTDYSNATIDGSWESGILKGEVTVLYTNGSKYIGNLSEDKRNGKGTFYFANGDIYTGEWSDDQFEGKGVYKFKNGSYYEGNWKDGKLDSEVYYTSETGKYKCKFRNGEVINAEGSF